VYTDRHEHKDGVKKRRPPEGTRHLIELLSTKRITDDIVRETWVNLYSNLPASSPIFIVLAYRSNGHEDDFFLWMRSTSCIFVEHTAPMISYKSPPFIKVYRIHYPPPRIPLAYNHLSSVWFFDSNRIDSDWALQWYADVFIYFLNSYPQVVVVDRVLDRVYRALLIFSWLF